MHFEPDHIYHIFNQGNNKQKIFFEKENYLYFLRKVHDHIKPYADILAWCLMPNHFHLMVFIRGTTRQTTLSEETNLIGQTTLSRQTSTTESHLTSLSDENISKQLTRSIANMLSSYTRAINQQQSSSGSLFRPKTKALCLTKIDKVSKAWYVSNGVSVINTDTPEKQYPNVCYNYILFNPLKAGIVKKNEDWEFSSYPDAVGLRKGKLISRCRISELGLEVNPSSLDFKSSDD
jgi:putative transposase